MYKLELTDTAKALFAKAQQHAETEVTVRRLVEVLQSPHMRALRLQPLLQHTTTNMKYKIKPSYANYRMAHRGLGRN